MITERLAFDTSKYRRPIGFNVSAFIEDLGGLSLEANMHAPLNLRINTFTLEEATGGKVINSLLGDRDVSEYYAHRSSVDTKESSAGLKMRDVILQEPPGTMAIWISPSGGENKYTEGRIVIGINTIRDSRKMADSFGIPVQFTADESLGQFNSLFRQAHSVHPPVFTPEDIRDQVLVFSPSDRSHFEMLREHIPMDEVWDAIESGFVHQQKQAAVEDATAVWREVEHLFKNATTPEDYISAGAQAEYHMAARGRVIHGSSCGVTNSDLINRGSVAWRHTELSNRDKYVKKCGQCGVTIEAYIHAGYKCKNCGGVYEGC